MLREVLPSLIAVTSSTVIVYCAAGVGAVAQYRIECQRVPQRPSWRGLWQYLLPPGLIRSPWVRLDLVLLAFHALSSRLFVQLPITLTTAFAISTSQLFSRTATNNAPILEISTATTVGFIVLALLVTDFMAFYWHYLTHRIPFLWEFHKAHHAREVLTPPSARSVHPVDQLLGMILEGVPLGLLAGVYGGLSGESVNRLLLLVIEANMLANLLTLSPLKHSHIDLRFGFLERFLMSPAHHQLHHSLEIDHLDKNFGAIFPFWDKLWHSFYDPPKRGCYRLGLHGDDAFHYYDTVYDFFMTPLRRLLWPDLRFRRPIAHQNTP